jgi:phage baseplate assembly protein W
MAFSPFLGKGTYFPFSFSRDTGGVKRASSENYLPNNPGVISDDLVKINGSIHHILSTAIGARAFLPTFGSNLFKLTFEPNDEVFIDSARVALANALNTWEKRITLLSIDVLTSSVDLNNNTAYLRINYRVIQSQVVGNFTFPFVRRI